MSEKITIEELAHFNGSETLHRVNKLVPHAYMTEGIYHLAEKGQCHWLMSDASIIIFGKPKVKKAAYEAGVVVKVKNPKDGLSAVQYYDMNKNYLYSQSYELMDFPFPEYEFWAMPNEFNGITLLLKSEY